MESREPVKKSPHALPTKLEKIYMAVAALEAFIIFVIAFSVFGLVEANVQSHGAKVRTVPVYLAIFILAQIFNVIYVFDGLRSRNIVQLALHLFLNFGLTLYGILQIPQTKNALEEDNEPGACGKYPRCTGPDSFYNQLEKFMIVAPIVFGVASIAFAVMIRKMYVQFGWAEFHLVGASPEMKKMHREYQTLVSLLKMLIFFAMAFCIAYIILITAWKPKKAEFIITIIALPLLIFSIFLCGWALKAENKPTMGFCLFLMVAGIAYFIYKLASLWLPKTSTLYINTKITMAIFSIFAVIILIVTFFVGCICMSNFGKGLKDAHRNPENRTTLWSIPANFVPGEKKMEEGREAEEREARVTIE
ncbi:hypothetical protein CI109_104085 [Kwoniella shandongensis]|uniref:Uncharacterized protein n=1 Tax=Kwoniella shandongensis TaxID=1734106 RepID=A0AAJ8LJ71_9TREE